MRYVTRPKAWYDAESVEPTSAPSVQIEPTPARYTGLLSASGQQIWVEPDPIGFRFQEQDRG